MLTVYIMLLFALWYLFFQVLGIRICLSGFISSIRDSRSGYNNFVNCLIKSKIDKNIPKYKFFSGIVEQLILYQKRYGIEIREPVREIRKAAQLDHKEEKRVNSEFSGLIVQYLLISVFTWFFVFNTQASLEIKFSISNLLILVSWQLIGITLGVVIFHYLKHKLFKSYHSYFYTLYLFKSLIYISRPVSEVIKLSKFTELKQTREHTFVYERLKILIKGLKSQGYLPMEELSCLCVDLWDSFDNQFSRFHKIVIGLKLFLILLFVLPGFLFAMYLSMSKLAF